MKTNKPVVERFWEKVDRDSDCWLWRAATYPDGYGHFWDSDAVGSKSVRAHRYSYELANGPIQPGLVIDHLCRTPLCVNPDHLEAVTCLENRRRGFNPTAVNRRKVACIHGHPFTPENTGIRPDGSRRCLTCNNQRLLDGKGKNS